MHKLILLAKQTKKKTKTKHKYTQTLTLWLARNQSKKNEIKEKNNCTTM